MISAIICFLLTWAAAELLIKNYGGKLRHPKRVFTGLFFYHTFFAGLYYAYAYFSRSDSKAYYLKIANHSENGSWLSSYGVGTPFIEFLGFPFVRYLGFSYEAMMLLFSFWGFVGIFFAYLFISERIQFQHRLFGVDFMLLLLFLPNMHFWSVSLGKGSVMLMGISLFFYGLKNFRKRLLPLFLGVFLVYHIRAHIMLVFLLAILFSAFISSRGIKNWQKAILVVIALAALSTVLDTFLNYANIEETDMVSIESFTEHRASELTKATSGVDITNYNQAEKLFSFWFRPLFVDAPNALGLFVSFENFLYLFLFIKLLSFQFIRFFRQADWMVKMSLIAFFGVSLALAQVSGNLGIAIRQKSQVMYLFLFVVLAYADYAYRTRRKLVIGE